MNRPPKARGKTSKKHQDFDGLDDFLKESMSSDESSLDTARMNKLLEPQKNNKKQPWWAADSIQEDSDSEDMAMTGKKFLKKKKPPDVPKVDTSKLNGHVTFGRSISSGGPENPISRDSLDDESLQSRKDVPARPSGMGIPALSLGSTTDTMTAGVDTLNEEADKQRFFKELKHNSDNTGTLDFSALNRELDKSNTLGGTLDSGSAEKAFMHTSNGHVDEEEEDEEDEEDGKLTAKRRTSTDIRNDQAKNTVDKDPSNMLSKVALLDSLDSTLGMKAAESQEARDDDNMTTIPEGHEGTARGEESARLYTGDHRPDTITARGTTLKTGTALGCTDTSREIEALHDAMRKVGMGTMDDTKDFTLKDSSRTQEVTDDITQGGTGTFGMHLLANKTEKSGSRTGEDFLREVQDFPQPRPPCSSGHGKLYTLPETLQGSADVSQTHGFEVHDLDQHDGYDMSRHQQDGYDMSPLDKYVNAEERYGFDLQPVTPGRYDIRDSKDSTGGSQAPIPAKRTKKPKENENLPRERSRGRSAHKSRERLADSSGSRERVSSPKREKFSHISSSGYGKKSPTKQSSKTTWTPAEIQKQKIKGTSDIHQVQKELASAINRRNSSPQRQPFGATSTLQDNQLVKSIHSFASYIQDHCTSDIQPHSGRSTARHGTPEFSNDSPIRSSSQRLGGLERERRLMQEVQEWQSQWQDERRMHAKLKADISQKEKDFETQMHQLRLKHEEEIFHVKQENYILAAKIPDEDKARRRTDPSQDGSEAAEMVSKETAILLEKEIKEQEKLLSGYQQENERLYQQTKKMQNTNKTIEEKMFKENQKLSADVANLREELARKELQLKHKGVITSPAVQQQIAAGNMTADSAPRDGSSDIALRQAKMHELQLQREISTLKQDKQELKLQMEDFTAQTRIFEDRLRQAQAGQETRVKEVNEQHAQEVEKLTGKLRWYAENQELLDKDSKILQRKNTEIAKLKAKIEEQNTDSGRKVLEAKARTQQRTTDQKRIQDLERQVKEMETIVKKRHPNSLPVLMWAASAAPDSDNKSLSVDFLEKQIRKLEEELESKDEEGKRSLRVIEQKYNSMKFQYEEQVKSLETRLGMYERQGDVALPDGARPHTSATALQRELDSCKERHREKVSRLEEESGKMQAQLSALRDAGVKPDIKSIADEMKELNLRIKALQLEVTNQQQEKQLLQTIIDRLQKDKNLLVMESARSAQKATRAQGEKLQSKLTKGKAKPGVGKKVGYSDEQLPSPTPLPPYPEPVDRDREYEPHSFAGQHISDILRENDALKIKMDCVQLDLDQQRVHSQKVLAECEARDRRVREDSDDRLSALKTAHQSEIQRLLSEQVHSHSTSRLAELQSKVDTQEVVIQHLKDQAGRNHLDQEKLSLLKIRETTLESQIKDINEELLVARQSQAPEMRHFEALRSKVKQMEARHAQREHELQQIISKTRSSTDCNSAAEIEKWKKIVEQKNQEIEKFRAELDSILTLLRELQRQGVVFPNSQGMGSRSGSGSLAR